MASVPGVLPRLAVLTGAECILNISLFPRILPGKPITELFILLGTINISLWAFYRIFIYPYWFSPWRHYARPKGGLPLLYHGTAISKKPSGEAFRKFINEVPNDGIIRFPSFFNLDWLLLTSPASLSEVLVHKSYDYQKPGPVRQFLSLILGEGLVVVEDEEHKFQRKHVSPAFHFRHIKNLYPIFWSKAVEMSQCIAAEIQLDPKPKSGEELKSAQGVVEINHWSNRATLDIIGIAALGKDFCALKNPHGELIQTYEEILEPTTEKGVFFALHILLGRRFISFLPWSLNDRLKVSTGKLRKYCLDLIREKKQAIKIQGEEDVDILSLLMKSNNFSDENLVDQLLTFLAAGHETTSSAFTWATYLIAKHPDIQTRLRDEIRQSLPPPSAPLNSDIDIASILESLPLLNGVCNEVLRLYPTVPVTLRTAVRPTLVGTVHIPKGSRIYISPWAINRSPKIWGPEAELFSPGRWIDAETGKPNNTGGVTSNYCNMTFLHGPRSCIGERFAKSELRALIAVFVGMFDLEMADPNEIPEPNGAITTKPKNGMNLRLKVVEGW
ncbi:Cytochrome P450 monooxygenase FUM15 [Hyphodiscus hymeniophilus]|uniref:Cytochrome P450 monooxygenase FUM15 n=1 Tax=Hyphodiscus hymeniophilus TaxID=353542 RepID=A0A9P6VGA0_9HELO|nr:Cytochrome P450 monooxygenase FUM15 [Hyphodiscus hymeniophilus]